MRTNLILPLCLLFSSSVFALGNDHPPRKLDLSAQLGSVNNPVRAFMPVGEWEYFMRLRCIAGDTPTFERKGSIGAGPYENVLDSYAVNCATGLTATVIIDMYHQGYREMTAVPGFTILPDLPARVAKGCPPEVSGTPIGQYIFNSLEVGTPAHINKEDIEVTRAGISGRAFVRMVVDASGVPDPATIKVFQATNEDVNNSTLELVKNLRITPAMHHADCTVPQHVQFTVTFK